MKWYRTRQFPVGQTFQLEKSTSTAWKSRLLNLLKLWSLVTKYYKMWKIYNSCEVCEFCILLYYTRKNDTTTYVDMLYHFSACNTKVYKICKIHRGIYLHILQYSTTKLHKFTKVRMLFSAVSIDFPNSRVRVIGNWSIVAVLIVLFVLRHHHHTTHSSMTYGHTNFLWKIYIESRAPFFIHPVERLRTVYVIKPAWDNKHIQRNKSVSFWFDSYFETESNYQRKIVVLFQKSRILSMQDVVFRSSGFSLYFRQKKMPESGWSTHNPGGLWAQNSSVKPGWKSIRKQDIINVFITVTSHDHHG